MEGAMYLKPNAIVEPLVNQWYAWVYLVPPQSAAMFLAGSHLKLLDAFAEAPEVHVAALADPALAGGPFIGHPVEAAATIGALAARTRRENGPLLELAEAIQALESMLAQEGDGGSLEPLYARVPEALRGFVELTYDINDQPGVRFFEPLLYASRYYDTSTQGVALSLVDGDARGYSLSTPRLPRADLLIRRLPFASEHLDALFRMRRTPGRPEDLCDPLAIGADDLPFFQRLFTPEPPRSRPAPRGLAPQLLYFGHACVLVENRDVSILFDPVVAHDHGGGGRLTHHDLPARIDYVVLTHNHQDHCLLETLLELRHRIGAVVVPRSKGDCRADPSLRLVLRQLGFPRVVELDPMDALDVPGGRIRALPFLGEHADLDIRTKAGFAVALGGTTALFLADSNNLEPRLYEHVHAVVGDADVVFIGMECEGSQMSWLYGPLRTRPLLRKHDRARRFTGSDARRAAEIMRIFRPRQVYVYAMGQEPWLGHVMQMRYTAASLPIVESDKLVAECRRQGMVAERLYGCKIIDPSSP